MFRPIVLCSLIATLAACNGTNPFMVEVEAPAATAETGTDAATDAGTATNTQTTTSETTTDTGEPISSDRTILPGTSNPSPADAIFRREARSDEQGDGYAEGVAYDGATDTFTVDNLAFDGIGPYTAVRDASGNRFGMGPFSVFENEATAVDGLTLANINQLNYRALYGVGPDGDTSIAIIRTGAFVEYGFGGFIYQRDGGVELPTSGQALYTGTNNYGGLRDFNGTGGLEYVRGDAEVRIDFNDYNEGSGVIGVISNRRVFDLDGDDITSDILSAFGGGLTQLPTLRFVIEPGVLDSNGELSGQVRSNNPFDSDAFETGNYYAVLSGTNARTITGVIVVTAEDPRNADVTVRETAGFFAVRQ